MPEYETINVSCDPRGVATLTLDRAEKHNAMSAQMISELTQAAKTFDQDDTVRAVVLRAEGKSFCAGGDLGWMQDQMKADPETRAREAKALAMMLYALNGMGKPLIGRIHANAFGGGVGLAAVCDVAIGVEGLKMGLTETRLGLIPATIGPYVVARMGEAKARRVFMSARLFDAQEAVGLDLLCKAVTSDALDAAVEAEVIPYLSVSPVAVSAAKRLALSFGAKVTEATIDRSIRALVETWETDDAKDGVAAFFEKRPARWVSK